MDEESKPQRHTIAATKFRESFSGCIKKIEEHGDTYVIEKHGNPTAVITPYNPLLHTHPIETEESEPLDPAYYAADRRYSESARLVCEYISRSSSQAVKDLVEFVIHKDALAKHGDPKKSDYLEFLKELSPSWVKRIQTEEEEGGFEEDAKALERQRMEAKAHKNQPSASPLHGGSSVNKKK